MFRIEDSIVERYSLTVLLTCATACRPVVSALRMSVCRYRREKLGRMLAVSAKTVPTTVISTITLIGRPFLLIPLRLRAA